MKGKRRSSVHTNYLKSVETIQTNLEVYCFFRSILLVKARWTQEGPGENFFGFWQK